MHPRSPAIGGEIGEIFAPPAYRMRAVLFGLAVSVGLGMPSGRAAEIEVTKDPTHRWGESKIAVNPKNPDNLVIAAFGTGFTKDCQARSPACRLVAVKSAFRNDPLEEPAGVFTAPDFNVVAAFVSFDRGKTWKRVNVPVAPYGNPDLTGAGAPDVAVTADGTFYLSVVAANWGTPAQVLPAAAVAVSKSADGGLTWSMPVKTGTPLNGPKLSADLSTGTVYEASSGILGPRSTGDAEHRLLPLFVRWWVSSKDGMKWTQPLPMVGTRAVPAAGKGMFMSAARGAVAAAFEDNGRFCGIAKPPAKPPCIVFEFKPIEEPMKWWLHVLPSPADAVASVENEPMVAADPTKSGHFTVAVPMNGKEYDVYRTQDSGSTWTGPVVLTEDNTKIHYRPSIAYSPDGILGIMWHTAQPPAGQSAIAAAAGGPGDGGPPDFPYNVWAAISRDGGASFSAPLEVGSADSPAPPSGPFQNDGDDYSSIAVSGDHVYVAWADWRSQERAVFFRDIEAGEFKGPK